MAPVAAVTRLCCPPPDTSSMFIPSCSLRCAPFCLRHTYGLDCLARYAHRLPSLPTIPPPPRPIAPVTTRWMVLFCLPLLRYLPACHHHLRRCRLSGSCQCRSNHLPLFCSPPAYLRVPTSPNVYPSKRYLPVSRDGCACKHNLMRVPRRARSALYGWDSTWRALSLLWFLVWLQPGRSGAYRYSIRSGLCAPTLSNDNTPPPLTRAGAAGLFRWRACRAGVPCNAVTSVGLAQPSWLWNNRPLGAAAW